MAPEAQQSQTQHGRVCVVTAEDFIKPNTKPKSSAHPQLFTQHDEKNDPCSPPLLTQADAASESIARAEGGIPHDRRVQQRISIAAVLSFQNHLRRHSTDPSTHPSLLRCVSSKFSQRARDVASEQGRQLFCEVHQPAKGSDLTIPLHISKFPALKRKSDAARYDMEANGQPEQKKRRCVTMV
eukprot:scaffold2335_cov128-Skeletonema_marinoi.AAC.6